MYLIFIHALPGLPIFSLKFNAMPEKGRLSTCQWPMKSVIRRISPLCTLYTQLAFLTIFWLFLFSKLLFLFRREILLGNAITSKFLIIQERKKKHFELFINGYLKKVRLKMALNWPKMAKNGQKSSSYLCVPINQK